MKIKKSLGLMLVELLIVIAIVSLLAATIPALNRAKREAEMEAEKFRLEHQSEPLQPPGVDNTNSWVVPMILERHLGADWILCRGKTNWSMIAYYQRGIVLNSIRIVPPDTIGGSVSQSDITSLEVTASRDFELFDPRQKDHLVTTTITEIFRLPPLLNVNPAFMSVDQADLDILKSRMVRPSQVELPVGKK